MRSISVLGLSLALAALALPAAAAPAANDVPAAFAPIAFLLGSWTGTGSAEGAAGSGTDRFALDLGGAVVVRHAHSTYASAGKTADSYDGLMVIYPDSAAPAGLRADSFDSGGHVIRYDLVPNSTGNSAQFVSVGPTERPTFRLTYTLHAGGMLDVSFEVAAPGSATFTTVAHGIDQRAP
jgi:hypothetical protein